MVLLVSLPNLTREEYVNLFQQFDKILVDNGTILIEIPYNRKKPSEIFQIINEIEMNTEFQLGDIIYWNKVDILPDNMSKTQSTKNVSQIYLFCRKNEFKNYKTNKKVKSFRMTGQKTYTNISNIINAPVRDKGVKTFGNKVFSTELVKELLYKYVKKRGIVFDPFCGTGSTCLATINKNIYYIASEIDKKLYEYSLIRILKRKQEIKKEYYKNYKKKE
ncbi:MAG: DNA methyltransferase [Clostridia bacterium]